MLSSNAITAACMISIFFTSTRMIDIIEHPIASILWPVISGGFIGKLTNCVSPDSIRPYVAGAILLLSFVGIIARKKGYIPDHRSISIPLRLLTHVSSSKLSNQCRVTYNTHKLLENTGPTLAVEETLTVYSVLEALDNAMELSPLISKERVTIGKTLEDAQHLHQVSGVFIHTADTGLVTINGPDIDSKHIMCIRID